MLVLHYTGMRSAEAAIERLRDPASRVSSHYVVDEDGAVFRLVPEERRAWHAGVSFWRGRRGLNDGSIGIEIVNPGHEWGYRDFPPAQMTAVTELCLGILSRHAIPARNVVAHSDIAPDRKQDPGERFDWAGLARAGVGVWVEPTGDGARIHDDAETLLTRLGFDGDAARQSPALRSDILRAFCRHWQPWLLDDEGSATTLARLAQVVAGA